MSCFCHCFSFFLEPWKWNEMKKFIMELQAMWIFFTSYSFQVNAKVFLASSSAQIIYQNWCQQIGTFYDSIITFPIFFRNVGRMKIAAWAWTVTRPPACVRSWKGASPALQRTRKETVKTHATLGVVQTSDVFLLHTNVQVNRVVPLTDFTA